MASSSETPVDFLSIFPHPASSVGTQPTSDHNMPPEQPDQNLYLGDEVLTSAVKREGIEWVHDRAIETGATTGSQRYREIARVANTVKPVLRTHDRIGQRIDFVEYHPTYHQLMAETYRSEIHSLCWTTNNNRPQTARSVLYYMWNQVEQGVVSCPNGMSYAIVPLLQSDPEVGQKWLPKVLSPEYDPRPVHMDDKPGITVAMSMTEKQGGSDVRANTTRAVPTGAPREYLLTGRKFFVSAPMADIWLITAQTETGVSLFVVPRCLEDGSRNSIHIQRLKDKLGNASNASSEVELIDAVGYQIGEDGRGIRHFIKYMTHNIRMSLSMGSAGIIRYALTSAIHHTSHRSAFGKTIRDQAQMANTLADMALESEAATLLGLRVAKATDDGAHDEAEELLTRILVPIAKYWNCRRAGAVTLESVECHGGMGYVEEQPIARFYREAPLNSIWEGTSAIMGLDVMRAVQRTPETLDALLNEIKLAKGADRYFDTYVSRLEQELVRCSEDFEAHARRLMSMIAKAVQGSLLLRQSTPEVADTFCASRFGGEWGHELGTLSQTGDSLKTIVDRAAVK